MGVLSWEKIELFNKTLGSFLKDSPALDAVFYTGYSIGSFGKVTLVRTVSLQKYFHERIRNISKD